jgi:nicotinate-nucleotide pyrophosphorylase (carboxylating)
VSRALEEDLGQIGDVTTAGCVPDTVDAVGRIVARESMVLAGLPAAGSVFMALSQDCFFDPKRSDGDWVQSEGELVALVEGPADVLLTGERLALNFLMHLSGVATRSRTFSNLVAGKRSALGNPVRVVSTRKTRPGMRAIERYAVAVGGCFNHRFGLFDGVLIKDNHIAAAGSISEAVEELRRFAHHGLRLEVEVERREQIQEALEAGADALLLDNMAREMLLDVVREVRADPRWSHVMLEASGGIDEDNLAAVADTGVDVISSGSLIHGSTFLDLAMELEPVQ